MTKFVWVRYFNTQVRFIGRSLAVFARRSHNNCDLLLFFFRARIFRFIVCIFFGKGFLWGLNLPCFNIILIESYWTLIFNFLAFLIDAQLLFINLLAFFALRLSLHLSFGSLLIGYLVSIILRLILFIKNFNYHLIHNLFWKILIQLHL